MGQFLKFILATIVGLCLFCFLLFVLLIGIAATSSKESTVKLEPNSVLRLDFAKAMPERSQPPAFSMFSPEKVFEDPPIGLNDFVANIRKAATDDNIKGIYLHLSGIPEGFASLEKIRRELVQFKESEKFIIAYGEVMTQKAYYIGSVADELYLNPQGVVELKGLSTNLSFFKNALDRLEIEPDVFYAGKFKSATEPLRLTQMSEENRTQIRVLLDDLYDNYLTDVSSARNMTKEQMKDIFNGLKVRSAKDAKREKVVDDLLYWDQVEALLRDKLALEDEDDKLNFVKMSKYTKAKSSKKKGNKANKIAVIYAEGDIVTGEGEQTQIGSDRFLKAISKARKNEKTKAIVLRVNSGGGSALASDIMWRELEQAKADGIPVIASMGDVAASGGYYISCNADTILAEENTITGSIGVFGLVCNMEGFFSNKMGLTFDTVKTGNFSDFPMSLMMERPLRAEEKAIFQKSVDDIYDTFLERVATGRGMSVDAVHEVAQGRVWTGTQAKANGLVDVLGGLDQAIEIAATKAGLEEGDYRISSYPTVEDPMTKFLKSIGADVKQDLIKEELGDFYMPYMKMKKFLKMQGVQARMPFEIEVY